VDKWLEQICVQVAQRLRLLLFEDCTKLNAVELVKRGFCDPIKVFTKDEPHIILKIVQGRLRLICSVSVVDNLVERVLFRLQNRAEIMNWRSIPSKPGMGLDDAPMEILYEDVRSRQMVSPVVGTDVSGWDWSVQEWDLMADAQCRIALAGSGDGSPYATAVYNRIRCLSHKVFVLSDGRMFAQFVGGVQASGSYNTSSTNSRMRVLNAYATGASWAMAMGDDALESGEGDKVALYAALGKRVSFVDETKLGEFEFCSTKWQQSPHGVPVTWPRTMYRYLSHKENPLLRSQWDLQLRHDLRHHPRGVELYRLAQDLVAAPDEDTE